MAAEQDPIERHVFITARPETVFKFLVEPELMARWIGRVQFAMVEEGGPFRLQFTFGDGHTATGVFTEISPPQAAAGGQPAAAGAGRAPGDRIRSVRAHRPGGVGWMYIIGPLSEMQSSAHSSIRSCP